jgi:hypothetical protein
LGTIQTDSLEVTDFSVTVESEASPAGVSPAPRGTVKRETKAKPKAKKYKEPSKDQVSMIASSMMDVYSVADSVIGAALKMSGKPYIDGLFELEPEKADKMGRALAQMNNSLPRLAEKVNKVSAPAIFFSVLLSDLAVKGLAVYGLIQSSKTRPGTHPAPTGQS